MPTQNTLRLKEEIKMFPARLRSWSIALVKAFLTGGLVMCIPLLHNKHKPEISYFSLSTCGVPARERAKLTGEVKPLPLIPYYSCHGIVRNQNTGETYTIPEFKAYYKSLPETGQIHYVTGDCLFFNDEDFRNVT